MSRSISLRSDCIERVKLAVRRSGFFSQRNLAESAGYALATVGKFLRGKPVDVATFVELCDRLNLDWQEVAQLDASHSEPAPPAEVAPRKPPSPPAVTPSPSPTISTADWHDAPDPQYFCGRSQELEQLRAWIVEARAPAVLIAGMGGIGKTTLAAKFARQYQTHFERVAWRSLRHAPSLETLLGSLLPYLSDRTQVPETLDAQLLLLSRCLRTRRCLLAIDNLESIFQGGDRGGYRPGVETYQQLFELLASRDSQSSLLLTSREQPPEFVTRTEVRCLGLTGLSVAAGWDLIQTQGQFPGATLASGQRLVARYGGNPLALKVVAATIRDFIAGNVADFLAVLADEPVLLDDLRHLLAEQFDRLGEREREVSYWLALACEPVSWQSLQANVAGTVSAGEILSALATLNRRSLIETNNDTHSQPAAVQEYLLETLVDRFAREIVTGRPDWFGRYALLQAQARDYARTAQKRLLLQPVAGRLLAELGDRAAIAEQLRTILQIGRDRGVAAAANSYLTSNVLHLLHHLNIPLAGWNFSGFPIRQANLQDPSLQNVSFRDCYFDRATFVQPFSSIRAIAFAPAGSSLGQVVATGDTTGEVRLWGLTQHQTLYAHSTHKNWICALAFSPDGKQLVSGCADGIVTFWNAQTQNVTLTLTAHENWVMGLAFSPDGKQLVSASGDRILKLWDAETGICLRTFQGHERGIWTAAFSPAGTDIASGSTDGTLKLWDANSGDCQRTWHAHRGGVWTVAFSPDGQTLASGGADNIIRLWDVRTGACLRELVEHENWIWAVAFSPRGNLLASSSADGTVRLWKIADGLCQRALQGHSNWVWCVAFSPYSDTIASGSEDRTLRLWEIGSGRCWQTLQGSGNWVWSVAFSPDGSKLASGSADRRVRLWSAADGTPQQEIEIAGGGIWSVTFSPDGRALACGNQDGSIHLWPQGSNCPSMGALPPQAFIGHDNTVWSVVYAPNGQTLASGSADRTVKLWDLASGRCRQTLTDHEHWVMAVAFSPRGEYVASASHDRTAKLWDVASGDCLQTFTGHASGLFDVAFAPQGNLLATAGSDRAVLLWDPESGDCVQMLMGHHNWVVAVAFSPDGKWLASGGSDRTIRLWDMASGQCARVLTGHTGSVRSLAFQPTANPQRSILASGSDDKTIRIWDVTNGECQQAISTRESYAGADFTGASGLTAAQRQTLMALGARFENAPLANVGRAAATERSIGDLP